MPFFFSLLYSILGSTISHLSLHGDTRFPCTMPRLKIRGWPSYNARGGGTELHSSGALGLCISSFVLFSLESMGMAHYSETGGICCKALGLGWDMGRGGTDIGLAPPTGGQVTRLLGSPRGGHGLCQIVWRDPAGRGCIPNVPLDEYSRREMGMGGTCALGLDTAVTACRSQFHRSEQ